MFAKDPINLPIYTNNIEVGFKKNQTSNWVELIKTGYVKEVIDIDDDGLVTIYKEYISFDKTLTKTETIYMSLEEWNSMKLELLKPDEIAEEMVKLNGKLKEHVSNNEYEICAQIRDKIATLKQMLTT